MKDFSQERFDEITDDVMRKYSHLKNAKKEKINEIKSELKKRWEEIQEEDEENEDE